MPLNLLVKSLLHSVFFTNDLKDKTINKTTCRTLSVNPRQLCEHYLKSFLTLMIFLRLSGFPDLFGKVFFIIFKLSLLDILTILGKGNANRTPTKCDFDGCKFNTCSIS